MHQTGRHKGFYLFLGCKYGKHAAFFDMIWYFDYFLASAAHPNSLFSLLQIYLCRAWRADLLSAWPYRSIFLTDGGNSGRTILSTPPAGLLDVMVPMQEGFTFEHGY